MGLLNLNKQRHDLLENLQREYEYFYDDDNCIEYGYYMRDNLFDEYIVTDDLINLFTIYDLD